MSYGIGKQFSKIRLLLLYTLLWANSVLNHGNIQLPGLSRIKKTFRLNITAPGIQNRFVSKH